MALGFRVNKMTPKWRTVLTSSATHIHSRKDTTPCYTRHSETKTATGGCTDSSATSTTCNLIVSGKTCSGTYIEYNYYWGYSWSDGTHEDDAYGTKWQCNKCGHIMDTSYNYNHTPGTSTHTWWTGPDCGRNTSTIIGTFKIEKKGSLLSLSVLNSSLTVTEYKWTYNNNTLSTTSQCKLSNRGEYNCVVSYKDNYSGMTTSKVIVYTY